jgi:1-hydroxy-2-methyl-2-(E)-butenyl 4-diphosphate synthase
MPPKRKIIPYDPNLKELASQLRKNMTLSEVLLWNELKQKKILGYDFDRQKPIDKFIVDFYCKKLNLAIEIDGDTHIFRYDYDEERQRVLEKLGVHFLRFEDIEVKNNMSNVLKVIEDWILREEPTPSPSREGSLIEESLPSPSRGTAGGKPTGNKVRNPHLSPFRGTAGGESTIYKSSPILIGPIPTGGSFPIRVQSMTNTNTLDTKASVAQCIRIIEAGADFVRLTAQGVREAENLAIIKSGLRKAGYDTPLIADIHFNPVAAGIAARIVEKVRINPGNYADKRASFRKVGLTDREYNEELERIHSRLMPLINICHENNTAVRIGVNHGSLSDRIMTRYGNTPEGMAISAMEFIRIFRAENFNRLVLSMKSSDTVVMVGATRALVRMMTDEGFSYPIHLGVTEAGEGEDGRIRSAAGIGALMAEGIGDTIRVSLTEDPEKEIPVAKEIISFLGGPGGRISIPAEKLEFKAPESIYKPEVLVNETGRFITESGEHYREKL